MNQLLTYFTVTLLLGVTHGENNLTALFHEALTNDGSLQSSVGVNGAMNDLELVYLRRHPVSTVPNIIFNAKRKRSDLGTRLSYTFDAFGRTYNLQLEQMANLVAPRAQMVVLGPMGKTSFKDISPSVCHFIHVDEEITAAVNACKRGTIEGYVVTKNITLEVRPLGKTATGKLHHALRKRGAAPYLQGIPHLVRKVARDFPTEMDLELPPTSCSDSISNATPDDLEFGQGELFTIPPSEVITTTATVLGDDAPFPIITPVDPTLPLKDPFEALFPPLDRHKREENAEGDNMRNREPKPMHFEATMKPSEGDPGWDREPKPMQGFNREPKPLEPDSGSSDEGMNREPKPMQGFNREPRPMNRMDREPKPMQGFNREPKPLEPDTGSTDEGMNREPKPMQGFIREPKPLNRGMKRGSYDEPGMDREPKPMQGFNREPKPLEPDSGSTDEGMNREPKPMQGFNREPRPMNRMDREPKPMQGFNREPKPLEPDSGSSDEGMNREPKPMQGFNREPRPMNRMDREPKPMQGFNREPKPLEPDSGSTDEGMDREPKPMQGFNREPRPMNRGMKRGSLNEPGMDREPKPMQGFNREPKPLEPDSGSTDEGMNREPKPMQGFNREPRPMNRMDREPKPMQGFNREPKPLEPDSGSTDEGMNREPKPMQGFNREPRPILQKRNKGKIIELGVFVDQSAYDLFYPYFGSYQELKDFILGYVNGVQALFHHPSLGQKIHLVINYVEVMSEQPPDLPHFGGEREKLYESFRLYNARRNEEAGNLVETRQWDMGILISGLNFFSKSNNGKTSYSTMGLAAVRGVCHPDYSAVIVELGATDTWGKPYPTAGFASAYVMAHEIGHSLGMVHDGIGNSCPTNGYVMSASRSTSGETNWSACSREVVETMTAPCLNDVPTTTPKHDHGIYDQLPGQTWDAYDQCRIFLRDNDATLYNESLAELHSVCHTIMCRSPHRIGYFKAGPALDGTFCGDKKWCVAGECVPWPAGKSPEVVQGGWSPWEHTGCTSGCIHNSTGVQVSRRTCSNPKPMNTEKRCVGADATLNLCEDSEVCGTTRTPLIEYAHNKCQEFSKIVPDIKPIGAMAPHNPGRVWQACAIFCQKVSGSWYSPTTDLSHLPNYDTYFPDGTLCHSDATHKYYCQRHQCLPKGERQGKELHEPDPEWEVHVYQNAPARVSDNTVPVEVAKIFELTQDMDPMKSEPLDLYHVDDEDLWIDDDYLDYLPV